MINTIKQDYQQNMDLCPECNIPIIQNSHEKVCEFCGIVTNDSLFVDSYQYNENKNQDLSSADQFVSIGKTIDSICTLGSHIDYYSTKIFYDHNHKIISSKNQKKFRRLKNQYSLPIKIKNHETDYRVLKILNNVINYLKLTSNIKNRAAYFYKSIKKYAESITNHISLIGFCIYYASREYSSQAPISIKELCNVFSIMGHRVNPKLIIRDSINYKKYIQGKNNHNQPHKSEDYINRFVNDIINSKNIIERMRKKSSSWTKLSYQQKLIGKSYLILKFLKKEIRRSRNPYILAGAVVYCADKLLAKEYNSKTILTQKSASLAMNIAEYSIRDHYVKILKPFFFPHEKK